MMKKNKLLMCLAGTLMLSACTSSPLSGSQSDGVSIIRMASNQKCMNEIENNPTWILSSKLFSEDQKKKKKHEVCNCVSEHSPNVLSKEQLALAVIDPKAKATYTALATAKTTATCIPEMLH